MHLSALQHRVLTGLHRGGPAPCQLFVDSQCEARFAVYRASYLANLTEALRDIYPVVDRLVGSDFFSGTARAYIAEHPSASGDLHAYGAGFPAFLEAFEPAREFVYLPDVARLEWFAHEAFHAAEAEPMALARLAEIPPERHGALRFRLHPTVRLLASDYPVHRIWQVNQPDFGGNPHVDLGTGGVRLAVYREGLQIVVLPLFAGTYRLALACAAGARFATACEQALEAEPGLDPGEALYTLIRHGLLVDITYEEEEAGGTP